MPRREFVPDEKRSLRMVFFVSSMILLGTTVWALWDESVSRRPWVEYQVEFKQLEYEKVQKGLEQARARLQEPSVQAKLAKLREELRWAEEKKKGPDYRAAASEVAQQKTAYRDINQELRFTRSELDEAFYWFDKARHEGGGFQRRGGRGQTFAGTGARARAEGGCRETIPGRSQVSRQEVRQSYPGDSG